MGRPASVLIAHVEDLRSHHRFRRLGHADPHERQADDAGDRLASAAHAASRDAVVTARAGGAYDQAVQDTRVRITRAQHRWILSRLQHGTRKNGSAADQLSTPI